MTDSTQPPALRVCCACKQAKSAAEYHRHASARDGSGLQFKCKPCCAEYQRVYNAAHGSERAAARLARRVAHADEENAAGRLWNKANPEKLRAAKLIRRAREASAAVGPVDLEALWTGICGICADVLDPDLCHPSPLRKSIDHIIPLSKGGSHTQDNLQWSHLRCNIRKGAKV